MTLYWPRKVLRSKVPQFHRTGATISGPVSGSGQSDTIVSSIDYWTCTLGDVYIRGNDTVRTWRGLSAQLNGRENSICIPTCRGYQPLLPITGSYTALPHNDDTYFSDGTGYIGGTMRVKSDTALLKGATSVVATVDYGGNIEPGHFFSFGERLYEVRNATYTSSTNVNITFRPPLREDVPLLSELNFDNPVCKMKLKDDNQMQLPLDMGSRAILTVEFVEDTS